VRRVDSAVLAVARLVSEEPDGVVLSLDDPSFGGISALASLKADEATSWIAFAVVGPADAIAAAKEAGADVALPSEESVRIAAELGRCIAAG
jgi:DNA-binding NarL/FixJ family response regulator